MVAASPRKRQFVRRGPKTAKKGGRPRGEKRIQADLWLDQYPIFRRKGFQIGPRNYNHPLYEVYCQHMYNNTSFRTEFASYECRQFRKKLADTTRNGRGTSGVVRPSRSHVTGNTRPYGSTSNLLVCSVVTVCLHMITLPILIITTFIIFFLVSVSSRARCVSFRTRQECQFLLGRSH
jgi:hypothetical protein